VTTTTSEPTAPTSAPADAPLTAEKTVPVAEWITDPPGHIASVAEQVARIPGTVASVVLTSLAADGVTECGAFDAAHVRIVATAGTAS
jgi:hypothetical protein